MGKRVTLLALVLVLCFAVAMGFMGYDERGEEGRREREESEERGGGGGRPSEEPFLLQESKHVVKTDAGEMRVVRGFGGIRMAESPMHIGFITMEPKSLYIPQYLDSSLILFVRRGEANIGWINKDELVEKQLKMGDVYRIPAGSAFYLVNTGEGQRLHVVCSIDTSESLGMGPFRSFFIGGGRNPKSVLAGFDPNTLATAFNVSVSELSELLSRQEGGPIVYVTDSDRPSIWANFMELKRNDRLQHLKRMVGSEGGAADREDEKQSSKWTLRKLLKAVFGEEENREEGDNRGVKSPDSYNLYNRKPDFKNGYGWSIALDEHDYSPLKHSGIGIYFVNLTAGSMMAPHVNPTATEYGIVLRGSGSIQIVFPNGTSAMNTKVKEGDVFWVPRYFPFCQIASRTGPMEFFGFTTSARRNQPQFLVGASSVLNTMRGHEIAAAFGVSLEEYDRIVRAQNEAIILPSATAAPPDRKEKRVKIEKVPNVLRTFGSDMVMGFD